MTPKNTYLLIAHFILHIAIFSSCSPISQYKIGEVVEVFVEDPDKTHDVLFSSVEHKGNNIKIITAEPLVVDYISATGNTYIKIRILRKLDDLVYDYEALYPHTDYKEYEIGEVLTALLRGREYHTADITSITEHRFVQRDGNIIKLIFDDPTMTHLVTTHSRFEATVISIKIIKKVKNKNYDYVALYIETVGKY
jgi:TusA-related sulfurtransferase